LSLQAEIYYRLNRIPDAIAACQHLLTLDADNVSARYFLGLCYAQTDHVDEAVRQFEEVLRRAPDYKLTRKMLGKLYLGTHRMAEGERLLAESRKLDETTQQRNHLSYLVATRPDDAAAHRRMAAFYQQQRDLPRAIVEWRRVLELAPDDRQTKTMLAQIRQGARQSRQ